MTRVCWRGGGGAFGFMELDLLSWDCNMAPMYLDNPYLHSLGEALLEHIGPALRLCKK